MLWSEERNREPKNGSPLSFSSHTADDHKTRLMLWYEHWSSNLMARIFHLSKDLPGRLAGLLDRLHVVQPTPLDDMVLLQIRNTEVGGGHTKNPAVAE